MWASGQRAEPGERDGEEKAATGVSAGGTTARESSNGTSGRGFGVCTHRREAQDASGTTGQQDTALTLDNWGCGIPAASSASMAEALSSS